MSRVIPGLLITAISIGLMAFGLLNPGPDETQNVVAMIMLAATGVLTLLFTILQSLEKILEELKKN